jgi:hypothetical protein
MKLVSPPAANGTFKPISTAVMKNTVRLKSTIENISFQRLVRNFSFTIFSPKAFEVCLTLYYIELNNKIGGRNCPPVLPW